MDRTKSLLKLKSYLKNPELIKEPSLAELADLVVLVLSQVKVIEEAIKAGRLDGKTPVKDVDYISRETAIKMLTKAVNDAITNEEDKFISRVENKFNSKVYESEKNRDSIVFDAIERINKKLSEVKDGVVTEAEIRRAATLALGMIELPDFASLIKESVDGETIRDALSLLAGDKRYRVQIADVDGLAEALSQVSQIRGTNGGTIGKQQVYGFIRQAIADGTITAGGGISDGDKGDITVSGGGTTWTIDNQAVTRSKLEHIQTQHFLGRHAAGTGDVQEVSPAQARTILNVEDGADVTDAGNVGAVNAAAASKTTPVDADSFSIVNSESANAIGRVTFTNFKAFLKTYFDTLYAKIGAVTSSGLTMSTSRILGRTTAGTGAVEELTSVDAFVSSASDSTAGKVELATAAETTTGTDATRAVTPDGLAGSEFGKRTVAILLSGSASGDTALATGDGLAALPVDTTLNGMNLVAVKAYVSTVSSSGAPLFQIRRSRRTNATTRSTVDMLTTGVSIDASEFESADATSSVSINTSNDDVQTGDILLFDCDTAGTGTKGAQLLLTFQLP